MQHYVASELGLHCLHIAQKMGTLSENPHNKNFWAEKGPDQYQAEIIT